MAYKLLTPTISTFLSPTYPTAVYIGMDMAMHGLIQRLTLCFVEMSSIKAYVTTKQSVISEYGSNSR